MKGVPDHLKADLLTAPHFLNSVPALSWISGTDQTAYRIRIYEGKNGVCGNKRVYDTGFVISNKNTGIVPGAELVPGTLYYWDVTVKSGDGTEKTSAASFFSTAYVMTDKNAVWCEDDAYFAGFDGNFSLPENYDRVILTAAASSPEDMRQFPYTVFVNGSEIGTGTSREGRDENGRRVLYYNSFDITDRVTPGKNSAHALAHTGLYKKFFCEISYFDGDGKRVSVSDTSDGWLAYNADVIYRPENSAGTHYYSAFASNIDLCAKVKKTAPVCKGKMFDGAVPLCAPVPPVKRYVSEADAIITKTDGGYTADLGKEVVGGVEAVIGSRGCEIGVYYGEELLCDNTAKYRMNTGNVYYEKWRLPEGVVTVRTPDLFTYRYVTFKGDCEVISVRGLGLRAELDGSDSGFSSDNKLLSELYGFTKYTVKTTTQDIYVDSQSRERGAYEGDMLINMLSSYCFYSETAIPRFSTEYIYTHRTWPAEYLLLTPVIAEQEYMQTGDARSLEKFYPVLKNNTFEAYTGENGLIYSYNRGGQGKDAVLTDWPPSERDGYDTNVKYSTVLNAVAVRSYKALASISRALDKKDDALKYEKLAASLSKAMVSLLYDTEKGAFCDGIDGFGKRSDHFSQHASAYALYSGICEGDIRKKTVEYIRSSGKIKMSVYGAYFLLTGLYEAGASDLANMLLLDEDVSDGARTWAYMMRKLGATLTAEAWRPENKPNMTFSHPWSSSPACFIVRGIFGIKAEKPGFEEFSVRFGREGINSAKIAVPTVKGEIKAAFVGGDHFVSVPPGCTAKIFIKPDGKKLYEDGRPLDVIEEDGYYAVTKYAGDHRFSLL